jgi:hypothetical protein
MSTQLRPLVTFRAGTGTRVSVAQMGISAWGSGMVQNEPVAWSEALRRRIGAGLYQNQTSQSLTHAYTLFDYITELLVELDHGSV